MFLRSLPIAVLAVLPLALSCTEQPAGRQPATISFRDSIRARRALRLAVRPDTIGTRTDSARIIGAVDAPVWIVVVSDFQCEACRRLALDVIPELRRDFVDRGTARLAFMNLPQDDHFNARFAAHASLCAASAGRFWEMHDSLFASQPRWQRTPDPQPFFDSLAVSAGVPLELQSRCTARQPLLRLLSEDIERSQGAGVTRVPAVFVANRRIPDAELTLAGVRRAVEAAISDRARPSRDR